MTEDIPILTMDQLMIRRGKARDRLEAEGLEQEANAIELAIRASGTP